MTAVPPRQYIYLHGFASSPNSFKARFFQDRFHERGLTLNIPDLNGGDFPGLTLTRQIQQIAGEFLTRSLSTIIIGSSLGGLTAAWLAEKYAGVDKLILLAPAFGFLPRWLSDLGDETVDNWRREGILPVYHHGERRSLPLKYSFVTDLENYPDSGLQRPPPTIILHGLNDRVIPVAHSQDHVRQRPQARLFELQSDHDLTDVMPEIWEIVSPHII